MAKDKARPGSLGARLLNFGRSRIQRYTGGDDSPELTDQGERPTPERSVQRQPERQSPPSGVSSAHPIRPSRPAPPSELPPVTPPQETLPLETRPDRPVRRAPRAAERVTEAAPPQRPEPNAEDRPRQTIGRDLLYILQRHEELRAAQETADFDADSDDVFSDAAPSAPATPVPPTQSRRVQRQSAPPTPQAAPPPGTPMPRRSRRVVEARAALDSDIPPVPAPSTPPPPQDIARKPAAQPADEPTGNWDMAHFEDGDEDTAALYDGDTVRYAQPETPPSAVPRRTRPTESGTDSRPVQRKPAAPESRPRKADPAQTPNPPTAPRPMREQINRKPERPAENPPYQAASHVPPVQAAPGSAPQQHDLPLIEEADEYEAPLMSDSFELNAGFDLTHQPQTPAEPIQRSKSPDTSSRSPVEHTFTEALPVVLPPTRRGRGSIEEFPTQPPDNDEDGHQDTYEEQRGYDLPYFDEETDRVTEQIDDHDYGQPVVPEIALMRQESPVEQQPVSRQRDNHPDDIEAFRGDESLMDEAETYDAASSFMPMSDIAMSDPPMSEPIRHELPSALHRATEGDSHIDTAAPAPESYFSTHDAMDGGGDEDFDENPYAQDFDDTAESDFDSRPDLYEALLRAGMIHNTPADAPIYRAPDTEPPVMPSFEGVYDAGDDHADDDDADTIYNYDDDDAEPEMPADEESSEELPFGSVEASLHDLMRYADDETGYSDEESSDYHTAVSFDDDDSDLYHVEFDPDADDDSGADHDDAPSERTPGNMIRRYADAQADLLALLDLPPDTPVSHGDNSDDYGDEGDAVDNESSTEHGGSDHTAPRTSRPRRTAEPPPQPITLADALAAPPSLPPQPYIAREMDGGDDGGTSTASGATNTTSGKTDENRNPSENPDVDKLAREVFRRLRSKLRIEQERRSD